jgi:D-serine deaminase-like pyridoxal phosphate-dependent protein
MNPTYQSYRDLLGNESMPFAFVDLDLFDENVRQIQRRAAGKRVRVATKSIRCVPLLERILNAGAPFKGLMCYSAREAVFLAHQGFDDILLGYPAWHDLEHSGLIDIARSGKRITFMVDSDEHVDHIARLAAEFHAELRVCIDIDMSTEYPGIYFGVRRSPLRTADSVRRICQRINNLDGVQLVGAMGYEAQIAGVPDHTPGRWAMNPILRLLKKRSIPEVARRRAAALAAIVDENVKLEFVNGGGTGSIESTVAESGVTDITVGSGFFSPSLFDSYEHFQHHPAAGFAIEVVRNPSAGIYTCAGGGYVASGATGRDKQPSPYLPTGTKLIAQEGGGEAQTPILYDGHERIRLGDPIFMRYAKAGEMCERFNGLIAIAGGQIIDELPTYRGEGQAFM